ncbi:hypothetical protein K491DRAFT_694775 [Lophiostoma macrostomum CBS 122681]|uniref:G-patch domain-containing protein n=1 Tax=Lophiostoma macrostomum CBS 122681 TaxID=1314788 RepID=A0A6A6T028_9PLEO|nr:hypothetical protein K491DRAFT_694775 [Lophiostoma macrostomum CBS 122681]
MSSSSSDAPVNFQQHTLDYYKSTADDDAAIVEANREARREETRRKKDEKKFRKMFGDWRPGDTYKLRIPTKVSAYRASGSFMDKLDDFTDFLEASLRMSAQKENTEGYNDQQDMSKSNSGSPFVTNPMFAPPVMDKPIPAPASPSPPAVSMIMDSEPSESLPLDSLTRPTPDAPAPPPPTAPVAQSAEEAFRSRLALAKKLAAQIPNHSPPPPPPPPAPTVELLQPESAVPPPPEPAPYNPTIAAPPVRYNATISAAPVHYAQPSAPPDAPREAEDDDERPAKKQRTKAPPKMSKAALMMAKMGYVKGQGLGKNSDGVTTHLEVKARKDTGGRQIPMNDDFESDGRTIKAQQVFDITGGHRATAKDHGPFGEPSRVIVAWGCVEGVDLASDAERDDGGIRQEMGDAFNEKFGDVERIHVNLSSTPVPVYIQFKNEMCALNAVNRFSEERVKFQGRTIRAVFYDEVKFNNFDYDH